VQTLFWLVVARVSGLFAGAPVLSHDALPRRYAILLIALIAASLTPLAAPAELPDGASVLVAGLLAEFAIGWCIGLMARLLTSAFQLAGTIAGNQIGLAMASAYDPASGGENEVVGTLHLNLAGMLFLLLDGHHLLIRGLASSFQVFPAGGPLHSDVLAASLFEVGGAVWAIGLQAAAPVAGLMLLTNGVLGFLNRANPQLSIFNVGFPLTALLGFAALLLALPGSVESFTDSFLLLQDEWLGALLG
jgi:flagellar biosynthetic protein FliR